MLNPNRASISRSVATFLFTALALLALGAPAMAQSAEVDDASALTVSAASPRRQPIIIQRPGTYTLSRDLQVRGDVAVQIASSDVTLDLAGHSIIGQGGRQGTAISIADVENVKVTNGKVRHYGIGVLVSGSTNVAVTDLQIDGQDSGGAPPDVEIGVLIVNSRGVEVLDNVITNTFLGLFVRGDGSAGNHLAGNQISGGDNGELGICYNPAPGADGGGPSGDLISGNFVSRFRRALSMSADSVSNVIRDNTFAFFDLGIVEATAGSNLIAGNDEVQMDR